jgi:O-methyltransferase
MRQTFVELFFLIEQVYYICGGSLLRTVIRFIALIKGIVILFRPHVVFGFLRHPLLFSSNTLGLSKWIAENSHPKMMNDFYSFKRDISKRYKLYQYIVDTQNLKNEPIDYLEFGVADGASFKWWAQANTHNDSKFYGFDSFEGLPEDWGGIFKKGEMNADIPVMDDTRVEFIKGYFQNSVGPFLKSHDLSNKKRKVIHMDADLFSSTLFSLSSMAPYLTKNDILLFDEFGVPNHEYYAFTCFTDSFYVKTTLLGAVNNYLQVAMLIQ